MKKLMMMLTGALMWGAAANAQTDFILRGGFATNTFVGSDYDNVDVIWAVYPNKDFNVKYAISNKFFESIYLNIPGIYAKDTMLGDYVVKNNIGMVINPYDIQDIQQLLSNVENGSINLIQMVENLKALALKQSSWDEDFEQIIDFINH